MGRRISTSSEGATSFQRRGRRVTWDQATQVKRRSGTNRTSALVRVTKSDTPPRYGAGSARGSRIEDPFEDRIVSKRRSRTADEVEEDRRRGAKQWGKYGAAAGAALGAGYGVQLGNEMHADEVDWHRRWGADGPEPGRKALWRTRGKMGAAGAGVGALSLGAQAATTGWFVGKQPKPGSKAYKERYGKADVAKAKKDFILPVLEGAAIGGTAGLGIRHARKTNRRLDRLEGKESVGKASRHYDADARRRHELGTAAGASGTAGLAALGYGGHRAVQQTRALNDPQMEFRAKGAKGAPPPARTTRMSAQLREAAEQGGKKGLLNRLPRHVIADRKALAALAAGGALSGTSVSLTRRARSDKNRTWG